MKLLLSTLALVACTGASAQYYSPGSRDIYRDIAQREYQQQREEALSLQRESVRLQREALDLQQSDTLLRQIQDSQFDEYRQCVADRSLFCVRPSRF